MSFLPPDRDLFDDAMDGGQVDVNGRREGSPELFDLSRLGESLAEPTSRTCRTPEAFLGPAAASLVNLDSLILPNQAPKNFNPFLSGETKCFKKYFLKALIKLKLRLIAFKGFMNYRWTTFTFESAVTGD